jgi:hypothetical protein
MHQQHRRPIHCLRPITKLSPGYSHEPQYVAVLGKYSVSLDGEVTCKNDLLVVTENVRKVGCHTEGSCAKEKESRFHFIILLKPIYQKWLQQ